MNASPGRDTATPSSTLQAGAYRPLRGNLTVDELIGTSRLILAGVDGVTTVVEGMHRNIAGLAPMVGPSRPGPTRGVTGLVYRNIRRVSALVGSTLDVTLRQLAPWLPDGTASPGREATRSALNGVLGDYLQTSDNPLAIPTQICSDGAPLALDRRALHIAFPNPSNRLMVMVHGLCMNDRQWRRHQHDHGEALAAELGFTPLYLRYNSGRPVTDNGRDFSARLETLVSQWPVPVDELVILGHSMGGLVARSACRWGQGIGHQWPHRLGKLIFLGTPHHGATLERLGSGLDFVLGISPYSAPIGRLGKVRSAGIRDLREGNIGKSSPTRDDGPETFPANTRCYAVAASTRAAPPPLRALDQGDGLVPLRSALGQHPDKARTLPIPANQRAVFHGLNHFDLLDDQRVYLRLRQWLDNE